MFAGTWIVGAGSTTGSVTVIVSVAVPVRLPESVAVQVTVVAPIVNRVPEAGAQTTGSLPSVASLADAVNVTVAPVSSVAATVWSPDVVITGGDASTSVTLNVPLPVAPKVESVPVHVTVVGPGAKVEPDGGVHVTPVTGEPARHVGVYVATVPDALAEPIFTSAFVRTGATP